MNNHATSSLLRCYQNQTAIKSIKSIKSYDATLNAMYFRQRRSDVYKVAMDYLVSNGVVGNSFSINDLIQDFRNYRAIKKEI